MVKRRGGFIGHAPFQAPDSPTSVSASGGTGGDNCLVAFTAPSDVGDDPITGYLAVSSSGASGTGSSSPVTVNGLTVGDYGYSDASAASSGFTPPAGRGIFAGGDGGPAGMRNDIRYFTLSSTGNTTDFGDLSAVRQRFGNSGASATRGIFSGGKDD